MRRVTLDEIMSAQTPRGGWTKAQLETWGVPWPPPGGWKRALIEGKPMPSAHRSRPEPMPQEESDARAHLVRSCGWEIVKELTAKDGAPEVNYWCSLLSLLNGFEKRQEQARQLGNKPQIITARVLQMPNGEIIAVDDAPWPEGDDND